MELRIAPGLTSPYRLALVEQDDTFTTLSEHDTPDAAVAAKRRAERAADCADMLLRRIAA